MVSTIGGMRTTGEEGGMKVTGEEMTGEHCCLTFEFDLIPPDLMSHPFFVVLI